MRPRRLGAAVAAAVAVLAVCPDLSLAGLDGRTTNPGNVFSAATRFQDCSAPGMQTLTAARDAYVDQTLLSANSNFGSSANLFVKSRLAILATAQRTLVAFNLPAIPSGCYITAASLKLTASSTAAGRTIEVYRVTSSWTEGGVTWNNQPTFTGPALTASSSSAPAWDVRSTLLTIYAGTDQGFLVKDANEVDLLAATQTYYSRTGSGTPPRLTITFA